MLSVEVNFWLDLIAVEGASNILAVCIWASVQAFSFKAERVSLAFLFFLSQMW